MADSGSIQKVVHIKFVVGLNVVVKGKRGVKDCPQFGDLSKFGKC